MFRLTSCALVVASTLLVLAAPLAGQATPRSLSLDLAGSGLPRLGAWHGVSDRWELGLELETDYRLVTYFQPEARSRSGADWRLVAGPSAKVRLIREDGIDSYGYSHASWGQHHFPMPSASSTGSPDPGRQWGLRLGLGADWRFAAHWSVGALYSARWLAGPGDRGDRSGTALTLRFHW